MTANKLNLDPGSVDTGDISSVFSNVHDYGFCPYSGSTTFPNYDHAYYRIVGAESFTPINPSYITSRLSYTPIIIKIDKYSDIHGTVTDPSYDYSIVTHSGTGGVEFHYVVVVDYGQESGDNFFVCMSSLGTGYTYGGFFRINTDVNFDTWCTEAYYPYIHTTSQYGSFDYTNLDGFCPAKIFPTLIQCLKNKDGLENIDFGYSEDAQAYIRDDVNVGDAYSYDATIPDDRIINFETSASGTNYGGYAGECEIVVDNYKHLKLGDGVKLTRKGATGDWGTIYVKSGGDIDIDGSLTIEYAKTGAIIKCLGVDLTDNDELTTINYCTDMGLYIDNCDIKFNNVKIENSATSTSQTAVDISGSSSDPTLSFITLEDSYYGIVLNTYTDATVIYSHVSSDIQNHKIYLKNYANLDINGRRNNIIDEEGSYAINFDASATPLSVENNWWGASIVALDDFFNDIYKITDYSPFALAFIDSAQAPAAKMASWEISVYPFAIAEEYEAAGAWRSAEDIYRSVMENAADDETGWAMKRKAIKRLRHLYSENDVDFSGLREIIAEQQSTAKSWYKASLDFIACDLTFLEGLRSKESEVRNRKLHEALDSFTNAIDDYRGTSMEVEMLCRMATIYGDHLNDRETARKYADRAASINPGQGCLMGAFFASGEAYYPEQYTDIFKDSVNEFGNIGKDNDKLTQADNTVVVETNPFNPITTIMYYLHESSPVKLEVYSISGQKIATLVDEYKIAGTHRVSFDGSQLASGVYLFRFKSDGYETNGKMLLIK